MKIKIWQFGKFDGEVDVNQGATVAEAIDAAELSSRGQSIIVDGKDAHLGMTLYGGENVNLVPQIALIRQAQTMTIPIATTEEELDNLFLRGIIGITEYSQRLSAMETENRQSNLAGDTLVFPKAA